MICDDAFGYVLDNGKIRTFETGAIRDTQGEKYDYEGFLSPDFIEAFGAYMHFNRKLPDGQVRDGDNWQKGFPFSELMKSLWRHFHTAWKMHRSPGAQDRFAILLWALMGIAFNVQAYVHQMLRENPELIQNTVQFHQEKRGF